MYGTGVADVIEVFQCYDSPQICDYIRRVDYLFGFERFIMDGQVLNTKEGTHRMSGWLGRFPGTCEVC